MMRLPFALPSVSAKWLIAGVGVLATGLIISLTWIHYSNMLERINGLEATKAEQELALEVQGATIAGLRQSLAEWEAAAERWQADRDRLAQTAEAARAEARRLNDIFAEHDLTRLAIAKPGLVERRINSGTRNAGRMLECASTPGGCPAD